MHASQEGHRQVRAAARERASEPKTGFYYGGCSRTLTAAGQGSCHAGIAVEHAGCHADHLRLKAAQGREGKRIQSVFVREHVVSLLPKSG